MVKRDKKKSAANDSSSANRSMSDRQDSPSQLQQWLDKIKAGDRSARDVLMEHARERLHRLTRKKLEDFRGVARWVDSEDVLQNSLLRLRKALIKVQPNEVQGFFALAAKLIEQELIDLYWKYKGMLGGSAGPDSDNREAKIENSTHFLELVQDLPLQDRELVSYHIVQEMTWAETSAKLGVTEQTAKGRWRRIIKPYLQEKLRLIEEG